ncbi:MAG: adenosylcobinamide-GDP ribazoletransferase [Peptostreptococcaceae bacterium]|jgi:adenosylcobinamide-GDP ribazoletransferase|nr:adenosylcobinamide-GDP ribazoletransferase [Peptostreptococcaceae bacterium]
MKRFIGMLMFLTRIPIKANVGFDENFHKGMKFFTLIGAILGGGYIALSFLLLKVLDVKIASIVLMGAVILLTGGLHLDGLADSFDGLYSYRKKDKILEIMKDSRVGTNGLLAVLIYILLKINIFELFLDKNILIPIFFMPILGRLSIVIASYNARSPRKNGMGNIFIGKVSNFTLIFNIFIFILFNMILILYYRDYYFLSINLSFLIFLFLIVKLIKIHVYDIIDGITGDILGCICELSELFYLFYFLGGLKLFHYI